MQERFLWLGRCPKMFIADTAPDVGHDSGIAAITFGWRLKRHQNDSETRLFIG